MSIEVALEISALADEAARLRAAAGGHKTRWPEGFKQKAMALVEKGVKIRKLSQATGIGEWAFSKWRRAVEELGLGGIDGMGRSFSEVSVVKARRADHAVRGGAVRLLSPRGYCVELDFLQVMGLIREGVL